MRNYDVLYDYEQIDDLENYGKDYTYSFSDTDLKAAEDSMRMRVVNFNEGFNIQILENGDPVIDVEVNNSVSRYRFFNFRIKELPVMHYGIYWDDEHAADCYGEYETLEEAKNALEWVVDSEFETGYEEIEWDDDGLGFLTVAKYDGWIHERTHRIHEIDEDGNWIDDDY